MKIFFFSFLRYTSTVFTVFEVVCPIKKSKRSSEDALNCPKVSIKDWNKLSQRKQNGWWGATEILNISKDVVNVSKYSRYPIKLYKKVRWWSLNPSSVFRLYDILLEIVSFSSFLASGIFLHFWLNISKENRLVSQNVSPQISE